MLAASAKLMGFLPTRNAERARAFYEGILGLRFISDDQFALVMKSGEVTLRIARVPEYTPYPFTVLGWEVANMEESYAALEAKGVKFERFPFLPPSGPAIWDAPGGAARVAWFKDPDGNTLSISQHS